MSDNSSDISEQWDTFLANIDTQVERPQTTSPESGQWESFLADVRTSPWESVMPVQTSESGRSDPEEDASPEEDDEYHPSPIPSPILYKSIGHSSLYEGNGDFQHVIGEWNMKVAETFLNTLQMKYPPILHFGV
jgi:hypothetical protein